MMKLTITFEDVEIEALRQSATREMRPTKEQVRWLLRQALGIGGEHTTPTNSKSTSVKVEPTQTGAFASVNP